MPCCSSLTSDATIGCLASGFLPQPVKIQWKSGSGTDPSKIKNFPAVMQQSGVFVSSSQVTIPISRWNSESFTCTVTHESTGTEVTKELRDTGCNRTPKITIIPPTQKDLTLSANVNLTCMVTNLATINNIKMKWQVNGEDRTENEPSSVKQSDDTHSLTLTLEIKSSEWYKNTYNCSFDSGNIKLKAVSGERTGTERKPSVFMYSLHKDGKSSICSDKDTTFISIVCLVKGFSPKDIYVTWQYKGNNNTNVLNSEPQLDIEARDNTYVLFSMITIPKKDWCNFVSYTCNVHHMMNNHLFVDETYNCEEEDNAFWSMAFSFITLFLISISYGAVITLIKTKWLISRMLHLETNVVGR
ncbi:hypothetical protein XELAEV_18007071mg [Xenopus laevis]|uniref:Ig-like domain-containing protein n=1 Tax=Xenopus laevis TaxID=8355 RepID=A0A974E0Z9_XENLA|nr:hypothetical protein XELAEV_18007071mg [Xenopus laevis]